MNKPITMNSWLVEKAMIQVDCACDLFRLASNVELSQMTDGPETIQSAVERNAFQVFRQACNIISYATAFEGNFHSKLQRICDEGPEAMKEFAKTVAQVTSEGWDLPNPVYHSVVVAVERPDLGLKSDGNL